MALEGKFEDLSCAMPCTLLHVCSIPSLQLTELVMWRRVRDPVDGRATGALSREHRISWIYASCRIAYYSNQDTLLKREICVT